MKQTVFQITNSTKLKPRQGSIPHQMFIKVNQKQIKQERTITVHLTQLMLFRRIRRQGRLFLFSPLNFHKYCNLLHCMSMNTSRESRKKIRCLKFSTAKEQIMKKKLTKVGGLIKKSFSDYSTKFSVKLSNNTNRNCAFQRAKQICELKFLLRWGTFQKFSKKML